jgi:hypothetical protein
VVRLAANRGNLKKLEKIVEAANAITAAGRGAAWQPVRLSPTRHKIDR